MILNSENIVEIEKSMYFLVKNAKNGYINYIIQPNISIKLYRSRITWMDNYGKNISLGFKKSESLSLLVFLRYVNEIVNKSAKYFLDEKKVSIFFEKEEYFYIKCFLPNSKKNGEFKYNIKIKESGEDFKKPRINCEYKSVIIDIRNIWLSMENNVGIHLELKEVEIQDGK